MPTVDFVVQSDIDLTPRVRQLASMFDCPPEKKQAIRFSLDLPIEESEWSIGLVVGPSGSGKSSVMRQVWGDMEPMRWTAKSVIDDFNKKTSINDVSKACQAVGFNTIPAWMRPFGVLSNGERFRVDIARRLIELPSPIVVDEFTSVVDRQVAKVASHAVQKYVRRSKKQLVAVTCHYDVIDWLQPDWVLDMATRSFTRRCLQRRPAIECVIGRVPYSAWSMFAPYHYMSASLNRSARCYGLWADGNLAAFSGVLPKPPSKTVRALSRTVTLPDWQGLGLGLVIKSVLGSAYKALGYRLRSYPAHPAFVRAHRPEEWTTIKRLGTFRTSPEGRWSRESRPCAILEWVGPSMDARQAARLIAAG